MSDRHDKIRRKSKRLSAFAVYNSAHEEESKKRKRSHHSDDKDKKESHEKKKKHKKSSKHGLHRRVRSLPDEAFMQDSFDQMNTGARASMKNFNAKSDAENGDVIIHTQTTESIPKETSSDHASPSSTGSAISYKIRKEKNNHSAKRSWQKSKSKKVRPSPNEDEASNNGAGLDEEVSPFLRDVHEGMEDSITEANKAFEWLIGPVTPQKFFGELWERKPLLLKRHQPLYYNRLFSVSELDRILRNEKLEYTKNIDVVSYTDGKRETHNPEGRAYAPVVWDYYKNDCSLRMLNPQTYSKKVWRLLSVLAEWFGSFVGANVYLTPPGTQGFAPHWDDIEAFILQLEGKKHWRLYKPRCEEEALPRYSSPNFTDDDIGEPMLDIVLEPGDLLYFPRGVIHQGNTFAESHSLHITLSTCQRNTWGDLLEKLVMPAVQTAFEEDIQYREALPRDYMDYMGVVNTDREDERRSKFLETIQQLMTKLFQHAPVDGAVDQMAKKFVSDALPPALSQDEKDRSLFGNGERWGDGDTINKVQLEPDSEIRLIRKGVMRLMLEDDQVRIYHCLENSRVYHEVEPQYVDVITELAPGVEYLIEAYPQFVTVDSLPLEKLEEKMNLAIGLYEKGLLVTREPLMPILNE